MDWIIDPVKSFAPDQEGYRDRLIIMDSPDDSPLKDDTLWESGKQAFDVLQEALDGEFTKDQLNQFIEKTPKHLIEIWNQCIDLFQPFVEDGSLQVTDDENGETISSLPPLNTNPDSFWAGFKIEPSIYCLDDLFEQLFLRTGEEAYPYDRRRVAAYFTLIHLDTTALDIKLGDSEPDAYMWVTRWFEKLELYSKTKEAMSARSAYLRREKSLTMNTSRHAKRNKAVELVISDWSERKTEFRSAEKAGRFYADWLAERGFEYEPRTITGWIRKFAKENNIVLR